jgi:hypothetical protein
MTLSPRGRQILEDREFYSEVAGLVARERERGVIPMDDINVPLLRGADDATFEELERIKAVVLKRMHYFRTTDPGDRAQDQLIAKLIDRVEKLEGQVASLIGEKR